MEKIHFIKSLGYFLAEYESDLFYISQFKKFREGKINKEEYLKKEKGTLQKFIIDFKVARNIQKEEVDAFLINLIQFLKTENCNDVDFLAKLIKGKNITHGKIMTSLCSKVLFLNNPYEIIPIDTLARKTLNCKKNNYSEFKMKLNVFSDKHNTKIDFYLNSIEKHILEIEKKYDLEKIEIIRKNRYIDKLLWTQSS